MRIEESECFAFEIRDAAYPRNMYSDDERERLSRAYDSYGVSTQIRIRIGLPYEGVLHSQYYL